MSSVILLCALSLPAHHHHAPAYCVGHGVVSGFVPKPTGCYGYVPWGCCGVLAPGLLGTPFAPTVLPAEERLWNDYLKELDGHERDGMAGVWRQADFDGRRRLLGMLAQLRADLAKKEAGEKPDDAPISAEEDKQWAAHLGTLKGDELANAKKAWADADVAGKRRLLKQLDK